MVDPLVLTGPPDALRADVSLENSSDKRVSVRDLVVRREGADAVAVRFGAILPPSSNTTVPLHVSLPATTPPGEYDAQVEIGGQSRTARLRVEAKLAARISPSRLLATVGDTPVRLHLVSQGNVDIPLASVSRARTSDGGDDPGPDIDLRLSDSAVLPAGGSVTVEGIVSVPPDLDPTRRHQAVVPVGVCDLTVIVLPRDVRPSDVSAAPPTPTARPAARRSP